MDKANVFKSSPFYMDTGDVLHILLKDLSGGTGVVALNTEATDGTSTEDATANLTGTDVSLTATSDGKKFLTVGFDASSTAAFSWQMYIQKYGARMVDWVQNTGLGFVTFMGGDLWIHNSDTTPRCKLFGEVKDCKVGVVVNENPTKIKILDSLGIDSNKQWEVSEIIIPASANYPNGMYSKIPKERFTMRDGVWKAEFLRNMKTTSATASVKDAISGEPLRGNEAYMILKSVNNPSGVQVKLFKVTVNMTSSKI